MTKPNYTCHKQDNITQPVITRSELAVETIEQSVKYVQS